MSSQKDPTFFGISVMRCSHDALLGHLEQALASEALTCIATPNAEMLLGAYRTAALAQCLQAFDLRIPDATSLSICSYLTGQGVLPRHPGVDVLEYLCQQAAQQGLRVVLLGGWQGVAQKAADALRVRHPGLQISALGDERIASEGGQWHQPRDLQDRIQALNPHLLAVALGGAEPGRQEHWILDHAPQIAGLRVAIGIGGALDMISGHLPRAPKRLRGLGLEWAWRLWLQPHRWRRVLRAVLIFPTLLIFDTIRSLLCKNVHD